MIESKQVLEWQTEREVKTRIQVLLRLLEKQFPPGAVGDLKTRIQACTDPQQLARWFDSALEAESLDDLRKVLTT